MFAYLLPNMKPANGAFFVNDIWLFKSTTIFCASFNFKKFFQYFKHFSHSKKSFKNCEVNQKCTKIQHRPWVEVRVFCECVCKNKSSSDHSNNPLTCLLYFIYIHIRIYEVSQHQKCIEWQRLFYVIIDIHYKCFNACIWDSQYFSFGHLLHYPFVFCWFSIFYLSCF